jgi:hypothetical protein
VNFNWIFKDKADDKLKRFCVELEYQLRPKITRFLMERLEIDYDGDFSDFYFDVDMESKQITLSKKTPPEYLRLIASDFEMEINQNCC